MTQLSYPPTPVFDSHLHIIDPRFPLIPNNGYLPEAFTVSNYTERIDALKQHDSGFAIEGGAVVSGSFQGFNQSYLLDALAKLGAGYVGVTQIPAETIDAEILALNAAGVRAVRFNVARGGSVGLKVMDQLARRVFDLAGWHAEFHIDARTIDAELSAQIASLPKASIDHLGMHADGLPNLLRLVEQGVKVKATGFGRVSIDPAQAIRAIVAVDPTALMVGTDLPSTRAQRPFEDADSDIIRDALDEAQVTDVFWKNAAEFYLR